MTVAERVAELERMRDGVAAETTNAAENKWVFSDFHKRITELVGRDVWTHELAFFDSLIKEVQMGTRANMLDVLNKFPKDMKVIVTDGSDPDDLAKRVREISE